MSRIRIVVTESFGGRHRRRKVILGCPCTKVGTTVESWEPLEDAITGLREQHRRLAPHCPHQESDIVEHRS